MHDQLNVFKKGPKGALFLLVLIAIVLGYCLSIAYGYYGISYSYDSQRVLMSICLSVGAFTSIRYVYKTTGLVSLSIAAVIAIIAITQLVMIDVAELRYSFQELGLVSAIAITAIVFARSKLVFTSIACPILVIAAMYLLTFFMHYLVVYWLPNNFDNIGIVFPNFSNRRFYNQLQSIMIPILVVGAVVSKGRVKYAFITVATLQLSLVMYSLGRGVMVSMVVAFAVLAYKNRTGQFIAKQGVKIIAIAAVAYFIIFVYGTYYVTGEWGFSYADRLAQQSTSGRLDMWLRSAKIIADNWLAGIGAQQFMLVDGQFGHPHNSVIDFTLSYGVLGGLAFVTFALYWFYRVIVANEQDAGKLALHVSVLSALIYSLFSGVTVMPLSQLLLAMMLGLSIGALPEQEYKGPGWLQSPALNRASLTFLICFGLYGTGITIKDYFDPSVEKTGDTELNAPRMWQNSEYLRRE